MHESKDKTLRKKGTKQVKKKEEVMEGLEERFQMERERFLQIRGDELKQKERP